MKIKFVRKFDVLEGVRTFVFEFPEAITWKPGQYLHYVFEHPNVDSRGIERWFTISNPPYMVNPTITTRIDSAKGSSFKKALDNLQPGDEIEVNGPKGKFVMDDPSKQYIFIAGGIGITPFHSIILQLAHDKQPINIDLLYSNRDDNFILNDELEKIAAANPNFRITKFVSPKRVEESDIKKAAEKLDNPFYYVSGPEPMVDVYVEMLGKMSITKEQIHTDYFSGYTKV